MPERLKNHVELSMECRRCGTCCVAPDIGALDKPLGVRCIHLGDDGLCADYEERPAVCRGYRPDEICTRIAAPTLAERVRNYLELFGLQGEGKYDPYRYVFNDNSPSTHSP